MNRYEIKGTSYLLWWIACALFVWPMAAFASGLVMLPLGTIAGTLDSVGMSIMAGLLVIPALGAVIGLCIGNLQRWLLRTRLYWEAEDWRRWSAVGGAVGALASVVIVAVLDSSTGYMNENIYFVAMPVFIGFVSGFQLLALRHVAEDSWLWLLGNVVGGIVFAGMLVMNAPDYYAADYVLHSLGVWTLATVVQGAITGYVMLFLFEKKLKLTEKPADDTADDEPESVWDVAI